jgi:Sugar kinases, ribokinase family
MKFATVGDNCIDEYEALGKCYTGGNPVNVAVYLCRLGEEASYTGAVGDDSYGKIVVNALKSKGVDISHVKVLPGNTAITKVELADGERIFKDYDEGVLKDFKLSEDDIDFLCSHDLIISGIWGMIEADLPKLKARGIPIAFDFSDQPEHPIVDQAIDHVTYAFFSSEEEDNPELRDFIKKMHGRGPKLVIVTLGEYGSICYDGTEFYKFGVIQCPVVDTMGAGDSYIAGFLRGIMLGKDIPASMKLGAESSSVTIGYQGAW